MVPEPNFDPDKDAARIETAIKTKGKRAEALEHEELMRAARFVTSCLNL